MSRLLCLRGIVVSIMIGILLLMMLVLNIEHNVGALRVLHLSVSIDPREMIGLSAKDSPTYQRLWGAALLSRGETEAAQASLRKYINDSAMTDSLAYRLIGLAYYAQDEELLAGIAFEQADVPRVIPKIKSDASLRASMHQDLIRMLQMSALSVSREALARGNYEAALSNAALAQGLTDNTNVNAEAFYIQSQVYLITERWMASVISARSSLNLIPPKSDSDERLLTQSSAASQFALHNECRARKDELLLYLLAVYKPDRKVLTDDCYNLLTQSVLNLLTPSRRPYVMLNQAIQAIGAGEPERAMSLLREAESQGLSPAWLQTIVDKDSSANAHAGIEPAFTTTDAELILAGYELDPIQVELGIPIDILLFFRTDYPRVYRLQLHHAFNMAPDPGFEFAHLAHCPREEPHCSFGGYARDIYGAPSGAHMITKDKRPIVPKAGALTESTVVLRLTNAASPFRKSGVTSSQRPLVMQKRYLHACWIKSSGGNGYVGRQWGYLQREPPYDYVVAEYTSGDWHYASEVISPPNGSRSYVLWLLNFESSGEVEFDDCIFLLLP